MTTVVTVSEPNPDGAGADDPYAARIGPVPTAAVAAMPTRHGRRRGRAAAPAMAMPDDVGAALAWSRAATGGFRAINEKLSGPVSGMAAAGAARGRGPIGLGPSEGALGCRVRYAGDVVSACAAEPVRAGGPTDCGVGPLADRVPRGFSSAQRILYHLPG